MPALFFLCFYQRDQELLKTLLESIIFFTLLSSLLNHTELGW